jgi:hypothetical protein
MRRPLLLLVALAPLAACPPPCKQVCRKVLFDCELDTERVALEECQDACETQQQLYDVWDDERLQDLFDDHRRCIGRSSCEEIADGACYDGFEDLYVFAPGKELPPPATLTIEGVLGGLDDTSVRAELGELAADTRTNADEAFSLRFLSVLEPGHGYTVDLFADVDGDGACTGAEAALAWRISVFQNPGDIDRTVVLDPVRDASPEACASFP